RAAADFGCDGWAGVLPDADGRRVRGFPEYRGGVTQPVFTGVCSGWVQTGWVVPDDLFAEPGSPLRGAGEAAVLEAFVEAVAFGVVADDDAVGGYVFAGDVEQVATGEAVDDDDVILLVGLGGEHVGDVEGALLSVFAR